jgi:hypothetical protein
MSETIEDVVKTLRDRAERRRKSGKLLQIDDKMFDLIADSIEAAIKREREATCEKSSVVGNAAKMRAALDEIRVDAMSDYEQDADYLIEKCNAALSAPPRNCDKYLTPKDAMLAHLDEVYDGEKVEFGDYEWCEFIKWLFAEAKGVNK